MGGGNAHASIMTHKGQSQLTKETAGPGAGAACNVLAHSTHTATRSHVYTLRALAHTPVPELCVCAGQSIKHTYLQTHSHTHSHAYTHTHTPTHSHYRHAHTHTHTHTHVQTRTH